MKNHSKINRKPRFSVSGASACTFLCYFPPGVRLRRVFDQDFSRMFLTNETHFEIYQRFWNFEVWARNGAAKRMMLGDPVAVEDGEVVFENWI